MTTAAVLSPIPGYAGCCYVNYLEFTIFTLLCFDQEEVVHILRFYTTQKAIIISHYR